MARPRTFDENDVITAARTAFRRGGFHGTSVGDLSTATGLGKGSLYGAFGDKHRLYLRIFDEYCTGAEAMVARLVDGPDEGALDRAREWLLAGVRESDTCGCLLANGTAELSSEDPEVGGRALRAFTNIHDALTDVARAAQRVGDVDPTADPAAIGGLILATHRGLEALAKAGMPAEVLIPILEQAITGLRARRP
jgi:TetR/AcrR family transcriptional regulator, transcriptional repressor for nem operon